MANYHYNRQGNFVRKKVKVHEKTQEELINSVARRWKPAKTLEEARQRADEAYRNFDRTSKDFNAIYTLFKKNPEVFLFEDIISKINEQYTSAHTDKYNYKSRPFTQLDNYDYSIRKLMNAARELYDNHFNNAQTQPEQAQQVSQTEEKTQNHQRRRFLTPSLRDKHKQDTTLLKDLVDGQDDKQMNILFTYLSDKNLNTVADFMTFCDDQKHKNAFFMYSSNNCRDAYDKFFESVLDYVYNDKTEEVAEKPVEENPEVAVEENVETEKQNDFYDNLRNTPAESFEKGSDAMNEIAKKYRLYLTDLTEKCIDSDGSQQDIEDLINRENKIYQPIVFAKREELEASRKRAALTDFARKRIDESTNFHHKNQDFSSEERHIHKHFPEGRNL